MYEELFLERLSYFRDQKKVSARDMSLSLGQSPSYINAIENHKYLPKMTIFFYMCEYFGISPAEFFDDKNKHPERMKKLYRDLLSMNSEQLDIIESVIRGIKK